MPERPNGAVLKTAVPLAGTVGSNPTPSVGRVRLAGVVVIIGCFWALALGRQFCLDTFQGVTGLRYIRVLLIFPCTYLLPEL